jgi:hypothetical protein
VGAEEYEVLLVEPPQPAAIGAIVMGEAAAMSSVVLRFIGVPF